MKDISRIIRERRSVRTFRGESLSKADLESLTSFVENIENPYGI